MMSVVSRPGSSLDRVTQAWVKTTGRRVDLASHPWLRGPSGAPDGIGDAWIVDEAARLGGEAQHAGGLFQSMEQLAGNGFEPSTLSESVTDFYERTSDWRMDVWSQWCPAALPFAWLLLLAFSNRLEQLSMPLRPLDVAGGIESQVLRVHDGSSQLGAAWLRTLRSTGRVMYSGWYSMVTLPQHDRPSIKVAFPLPNGSVVVFLRPDNGPNGELLLTSPEGRFGDDGAYLIVNGDGNRTWARRIPLTEQFRLFTDSEGVLRTDHSLDVWRIPTLRLHYRLEPSLSTDHH
jgi:hypothetical protein